MRILVPKNNNINNINNKNVNRNESKRSHSPKEILLVVCEFYIISMDIQRLSNSLFLI